MVLTGPLTLQWTRPQGDMAVAAHPSAIPCIRTLAQSVPVSWRQLAGSLSLLPFLGTDAMPGIAFPRSFECYRGSLGPWFPTLPVPWVDALLFVSLPAGARLGSSADCVGQQAPGCWLRRSPLLRRLLPRRREALPSSRITHLPTCPALRPRWCPARLPWRELDCCLPRAGLGRLWVRLPGLVLLSTTILLSEFNDAACVLASPLLRTPPLSGRPSVRLPTWWLAFGRVGLDSLWLSHPLGNIDEFQEPSALFLHPGFISARPGR
jgi:hypothetical protein